MRSPRSSVPAAPPLSRRGGQRHAYDARANPDGHTGIDLNGDRPPHGDIDRGEPVWAVAQGTVHDRGYSDGWLGVVVLLVEHEGEALYVRYGHLAPDTFTKGIGDQVKPNDLLGNLGDYQAGDTGDHLHLDTCLDPFTWHEFKTAGKRWIDPVPVLKAHLQEKVIEEMLKKD
jgi:murein DD-endopeptidase MepM/ murein hydrolase activator NlpD